MVTVPAARRRAWSALAVVLTIAALSSCAELPVEVSETELWLLELEQVDDGLEGSNPRRGTINIELRLNHTIQPDPTCAGRDVPDITTYLASVEVLPSRMADPASGSLDASWNCHGFSGVIRLDDGTTFDLSSEQPVGVFTTMADNSWNSSSGSRGSFLLQRRDQISYETRQSHFDLIVESQKDDEWLMGLVGPLNVDVMGLRYIYNTESHIDLGETQRLVTIPPRGSVRFSWPSHQNQREGRNVTASPEFRIMHIRDNPGNRVAVMTCVLGADHPQQLRLILGPEEFNRVPPVCAQGWLGDVFLGVSRSPLFIRPGGEDTLTVLTQEFDQLDIESSNESVTASVDLANGVQDDDIWRYPLTVRVAPDARRTEYGLVVTGLYWEEVEETVIVPVSVYELDVAPAADTLTIAPGARDTTSILLDTEGVFGDILFSTTNLPSGVLATPPSFAPSATNVIDGVGTVATFRVAPDATPGTYDVTVCAALEFDPQERCHPTTVTVVVPAASPDFAVTVNPAAIQMASGGLVTTAVQVNRSGPGVGVVTVSVGGLPSGVIASLETSGDNSVLTLNSVPSTPDGVYELTVEATNGPLTRTATLTVTVGDEPAAGACDAFGLRTSPDTVTVVSDYSSSIPVFVDRGTTFAGQVELRLLGGTDQVSDVLSTWSFSPNPVTAGVPWTSFSFTMRSDLTPGARYELTISGATPLHEDPTETCEVPIVFEVLP